METHSTCPFGNKCEDISDGKLYRCAWYTALAGIDPQGNETNDSACAVSWLPMLLIEQRRAIDGVQAATESSRNQNIKGLLEVAGGLKEMPILTPLEDIK